MVQLWNGEEFFPTINLCTVCWGVYILFIGSTDENKNIPKKKKKTFKIRVKARMEVEKQILAANHQTHNFTPYKHLNKQNHAV